MALKQVQRCSTGAKALGRALKPEQETNLLRRAGRNYELWRSKKQDVHHAFGSSTIIGFIAAF
jgi:hypothetical protein